MSVSGFSWPAWPGAGGGRRRLRFPAARDRDGWDRSVRRAGNAGRDDGRYTPPVRSIGRRRLSRRYGREISKRLHDSIVAGRELSGRSAGLASFRDILALGSFQDKQAALAIITRRFTPPLAPALRLALNDPDAAIRVQAATAAARIEDLFLAGLAQYTARVAEQPDDPDCRLALARHLLGHAEAGLCPPERAAADLEQALSHLRHAVALAPCAVTSDWPSRSPAAPPRPTGSGPASGIADGAAVRRRDPDLRRGSPPDFRLAGASAAFQERHGANRSSFQLSRMAALWAIPSETV